MAVVSKFVAVFRGDNGSPPNHYAKSIVSGPAGSTEAIALATFLATQSKCNMASHAYNSVTTDTDSAPGAGARVDRKAVIYFKHPNTLKLRSITIPAPIDSICEDQPEGERVTSAAVIAIVDAISTACGVVFIPLYGKVIQKP